MSEKLKDANTNPWYVLATVFGEQAEDAYWFDFDQELAAKNRRAWNGWFCGGLSKEERKGLAEKMKLDIDELKPLSRSELQEITTRFQSRMGSNTELPDRSKRIDFSGVYFSKYLCFEKFVFLQSVNFSSASFAGYAVFSFASFANYAIFKFASFAGPAGFSSVSFADPADFSFASFANSANFRSALFASSADFRFASFAYFAYFSSAKFKSATRFEDAKFLSAVPQFHAAELYDDTTFTLPDDFRKNWPPLKGEGTMPAAQQKRAYNQLRLFMNRALQIDEEQFFHRMEMRCKAVGAKWYHKPFYWLYSWLSDYGNSVWRPLVWMGAMIVVGALAMLAVQGDLAAVWPWGEAKTDWSFGWLKDAGIWQKLREAIGWSASNTLPFTGTGRLYYGGEFAKELSSCLKVTAWVQTLFGYILLFFLGLGLRNRFRLR